MVLSANYPIMDVQNKYLFVLLYQVHLDWKIYPSKLADRNKVKDEKTRNIYFKGKCLYRSLPDKRNPNCFISREITLGSYFLHRELTSYMYVYRKMTYLFDLGPYLYYIRNWHILWILPGNDPLFVALRLYFYIGN